MRTAKGAMLVETLVSTTIMSIIAVAFMAVLLVNFKTNAKVANMTETLTAVRTIKERIGRDVREGRSLGDVAGDVFHDPSTQLDYYLGTASFPSNTNALYSVTPPTTPTGWTAAPWTLGNDCLIVQVPVLSNHNDSGVTHALTADAGWPTMITPTSAVPSPPSSNRDNVETHVYMVLPDPTRPGEFKMEYSCFPGMAVPGYLPAAHTVLGQTILTGIIGPIQNGVPKAFQFVSKADATGTPQDTIVPDGTSAPAYTGVVVNLEVRKHETTSVTRRDISITPIGMKLEVFLRNNALATTIGRPSN